MSGKIALFAGSFDPFTRAHAALVEEALRLFDRLVIGVGCNISKRGLLCVESRVKLIKDIYINEPRVEVSTYEGLTVTFARQVGASVLVRGVRGVADLELERSYESVNRELAPEITTILLFTPAAMSHISSSCVRELLHFGEGVESMMPEGVDIAHYLQ